MTTQMKIIAGIVGFAILAVFGFCWKHDADARLDGRIAVSDSLRAVQQHRADSLLVVNEALAARVAAAASTVLRVDTVVRRRLDTVTSVVTQIVSSSVADTTKIRQLVAQIDTLAREARVAVLAGDNLARVSDSLVIAFADERRALQVQVATAVGEISMLKRQSRKWGLGAALGYGAQRASDGAIRAGPVLSVGVVYRY